jgi:hypothetical protein
MSKKGRRQVIRTGSGEAAEASTSTTASGGGMPEVYVAITALNAPKALADLAMQSPAREVAGDLAELSAQLRVLEERRAELVKRARGRGLSWDSIGWCVGTTGEASRQRWRK